MADTMLRQWHTLRLVPRAPRRWSTTMIRDALSDRGFDIDVRSVQRDLLKLAASFPLECDDRTKPFGWSWSRDAAPFDLPGMDLHAAVSFQLCARFLEHLLPTTTLSYLEPHFARARELTEKAGDHAVSGWSAKIDALTTSIPVLPPNIDRDVLETVHHALLKERRLSLQYRRRGKAEVGDYVASPLGLVYRDAIGYLVCVLRDNSDVRQLALHRIVSAELLDLPLNQTEEFDLNAYVSSGAFEFLISAVPLNLVARFDPAVRPKVEETPLTIDQVLTDEPDGWVRLAATLADTIQLRSWLRSLGSYVEVLEPPALRAEMADHATRTAALYST